MLDDGGDDGRARRRRPRRRLGRLGAVVRERIGEAVGTPAHHVLINSQHTHAAPPTTGLGQDRRRCRLARRGDPLRRRGRRPPRLCAAEAAARRLRPARIGCRALGRRGPHRQPRQRVEGGTILGWNPDEQCDRDVAVIRVDDEAGGAICTVVAFAVAPGRRRARRARGLVRLRRPAARARARAGPAASASSCRAAPGTSSLRVVPHRARARASCSASVSRWPRCRPARPRSSSRPGRSRCRTPRRSRSRSGATCRRASRRTDARRRRAPGRAALARPADARRDPRASRRARGAGRRLQAAGEPRTAWNPVALHVRWAQAIESASPTAPSSGRSRCPCRRCASAAPASPPGRASRSASSGSR